MARVFISHASEDLALAHELHRWLVEAGHQIFLDQDLRDGIAVGEEWEQRLHERLRWANAVVCVVTSAYLASQWCTAEVSIARSRGNRLLPVRAEPGVAHALLKPIQHTDLTQDRVTAHVALVEALRQIDDTGQSEWPDDQSPFPGLRPFDVDRHRVFFGRAGEVEQLAESLRSIAGRAEGAALLVVGPSGCGKSSLVRAGLLPVIAGEPGWWTLPPIVPGADPVAALVRGLTMAAREIDLHWTVDHVYHQLHEAGLTRLAAELLLAAPGGSQRRLLVVVDQFEELLTQTAPTERARFVELLRPTLTSPIQLVGTLSPEFLDQMLGNPELAALPTHTYVLRPLRREALRAVIEEPARLAGIGVNERLVSRLIEDTDSGEALPLLAFTLAQLADGISRGGQLSQTRYEQLGGVQGALTREADVALTDAITAAGRSREEVITGLLRLVTVDEQGRPTRWRIRRDELPDSVVTELDPFVARRLLSTDTDNGTAVIGVAHEAFLSTWSPLHEAIAASASALRARRAVEHAAADWHDHDRLPARLWGGGQLASAVADTGARIEAGSAPPDASPPLRRGPARWLPRRNRVLVTDRLTLSPTARSFLRTSIHHDRYRRRRAITVLSVLLVLALVGVGIAVVQQRAAQEQQRIAQEQQRIATARQLIAQAEAVRNTDPRTALQLSITAHHIHPSNETQSSLVNILTNTRYTGTLTGHPSPVRSVAFAPEGHTMATADEGGTVILWDLADPARPQRVGQLLSGHASSVALAPDGHTLATAGGDDTVILWDLTDPARPQRVGQLLTGYTNPVDSVAFAPDGHTLATASGDGTVILWDLTDPARPQRVGQLIGDTGPVYSATFAPNGHTLATTSWDNTVMLWDVADPARPQPVGQLVTGTTGYVYSVEFAPDGHTLATATASGDDDTVTLWDLTDPTRPQRLGQLLAGHTDAMGSVAFAPDGHTLATASRDDDTVTLWDLTDPTRPQPLGQPLTGHTGSVSALAFAPEGHTLATASRDGTVMLWNSTDSARPHRLDQPLTGHTGPVWAAGFAPDGHTLATASGDGTVILWDLTDPTRPQPVGQPLTGHNNPVRSVAFAPDGHTLATPSLDNTVILWDLTDPTRPQPLGQPLTGHTSPVHSAAFAPDGHTMATADEGSTVILWDLTDPARPQPVGQFLTGTTGYVYSMAFAPNGHTLATSSLDNTVILWDVTDPTRPQPLGQPLTGHTGPVSSAAFAPDGHTLATTSGDGTVILWDLTDPTRPQPVGQPLTGPTDEVYSAAFAPDGHTLATTSGDGTVILWDLTDPTRPQPLGQPLTGHTGPVYSAVFAPDRHALATASDDGTVILWDLSGLNDLRGHAVERACSITGRGLDRNEWARYVSGLVYQDTCPG